ncbi:heat shock protein 104 [[Candida] railenensis]|uniref:Heat shock protein 104 n=1 Tax=[Candida] railenensis TaxID=45579 RepID=A0A9P0QSM2_9ASCO|nr:heat shock protein 104 [[Candida] railenensis]
MDETQYTDNALRIITNAQQLAKDNSNTQLVPLHFLAAMVPTDDENSTPYLKTLIQKSRNEWAPFERIVNKHLVKLPSQTPAPDTPQPSYATGQLLTNATKIKAQQKDNYVAQDHLLLALLKDSSIQAMFKEAGISTDVIKTQAIELRGDQRIDSRQADSSASYEFLGKYCEDLTEKAREGKIDPVIGREEEIRRVIRVLARRTKSNSVLIGEAGVGKTSIVEGVAQRIIDGDVPTVLQNSRLFALDLGALTAGAKYKGEFEERIKGVLNEIEKSKEMIILFIDEIHMLMGDGKSDAANLLKPMLARGSLHCIGATTFSEYRKFISKDGAFERRFQKIDVPASTVPETVAILRGLQPRYEIHHGVRILDSALVAAAHLASRYLTYRSLPDSAVDLIDETAAAVAVARDSKPEELDNLEREYHLLEVEINALERDKDADADSKDRLELARKKKENLEEKMGPLKEQFNQERAGHDQLIAAKRKLDELEVKAQNAERSHDTGAAADLRYFAIPAVKEQIEQLEIKVAEEEESNNESLLKNVVGQEQVAETAARLTGIPVTKLTQAENAKLINMEKELASEVVGQSEAVRAVSNAVRLNRSGLANPNQPASFLFLGLSGSGKTELAKKVAGFLFADERAMIRIDCSELGDKWSASKLLGAAPGYVGYEEGGILTEALLRRPYSVILFDEVEKAAPEVLTILLQILDDGRVTSSQGKLVNCSNAIIIMTSNLGAEYINASKGAKVDEQTKELVMTSVRAHFRPEFLNRISSTVVFNRLSKKAISKIVRIRLVEIQKRFEANGKSIKLDLDDQAIDYLCKYGYSPNLGARPLNRLIQTELLNKLAVMLLKGEIRDKEEARVTLGKKGLEVLANHDADDVDMADVDVEDWRDSDDDDEVAGEDLD